MLPNLKLLVVSAFVVAVACGGGNTAPKDAAPAPAAAAPATAPPTTVATTPPSAPAENEEPLPNPGSPYDALPPDVRSLIDQKRTDDFDTMLKRRAIRVGVTFSRTHYFIDKGAQRGIAYESLTLFEKELNDQYKTGNLKVHVVFVPLPRDQLFPALIDGKIDAVAAMLTVTPERSQVVAFSAPTRVNVNEVVVTGPGAPPIKTIDDLSGQSVFVRKTSSYYASLVALNEQLKSRGKPPVEITAAPEVFEDDDVLEMTNAGMAPIVVVDDYMADFWSRVFPKLQVHRDVTVRTGGQLAVAVRKENPKLREAISAWIGRHSKGDAFRNVIERKYLQNVNYVKNAASEAEREKFLKTLSFFRKYGDQYKIDAVLMAAQGYQESQLNQDAKSAVGAVGVMQVMPATGKELNVGDIRQVEPNVHAGIKYMRFMQDTYFAGDPMDDLNKTLMAFAAYNCGPGRLRQLRREATKRGLNGNVWFGNVERVASERIGRETVQYVSNIYKYYVAYKLMMDQRDRRAAARGRKGDGGALREQPPSP